jgi:hypothetical protein
VHRVQPEAGGRARSVVVKLASPDVARRNRLVAERWLPAAGMGGAAPAILGVVKAPDPSAVWLVCEDVGTRRLSGAGEDPRLVAGALALIARLHRSFADHALLGEVRLSGGDLGSAFHSANLRDAFRAVEALGPLAAVSSARTALRERLLGRLRRLLADAPRRAALVELHGGPETLLHGDLWPENIIDDSHDGTSRARLIDWDHAGVGPAFYDVSTFLYRFPSPGRRALWETYRRALGPVPWNLPGDAELNVLCEMAEHARIANRVIWPALTALRGEAEVAFEELAVVDGWFDALEPVLR